MANSDDFDQEVKSKSQRKREVEALQDLGHKLVDLRPGELARADLPDALYDAVREAKKIKSREGRRRQLQYIGRLMREIDAEPIARFIEELESGHGREVKVFHELERWRDRLIAEGDGAMDDVLARFPHADRSRLRQLIRGAQRSQDGVGQTRSARMLFVYLRELQASQP